VLQTDQFTAAALKRDDHAPWNFSNMWKNYNYIFLEIKKGEYAQFGEGLDIPIWILGSSTESAYLAAHASDYPFLSHFARHNFSMQ
jgi:hypothetical protein